MRKSVRNLVAAVVAAAVACLVLSAVLPSGPVVPSAAIDRYWALAVFILLAALLESLSAAIVTSSGGRASSSVAAILYIAMIPLFGPFAAILGTAIAEGVSGLLIKRLAKPKAIFNMAQLAIASSAGSAVYVALGGPLHLSAVTIDLRTVVAFASSATAFLAINFVLVTTVVSLDTSESFRRTWRLVTAGGLPANVAAATLAFVLTLLYAKFQFLGVLALLLPLLFIHHSNHLNVKLHNLNRDLLRLIVKTIEAKDPYTSGHSVRVAHFCRRISEEMELPRKTIEIIETAALLHDFGKIDVAYESIIAQAGALTPEQRDIIRSHPVRGAELLASISTLDKGVIEAVRHHHENFDGTGYPDHLAGHQIPLAARVLMVADTVDAMLSARPYRPPLPTESVETELRRLSSRQFDPEIVSVVLESRFVLEFSGVVPTISTSPRTQEVHAKAIKVAISPRGF